MFSFLVAAAVLALSAAYPTGVPVTVCDSMAPGHGETAQTAHFDYAAEPSKTTVKPNEEIQIEIVGTTQPFKGFLLQIRDENNKAVGKFVVPTGDTNTATVNCHGGIATAASHKNREDKHSVFVRWVAPQAKKEYKIYLTIVKDFSTYWVKWEMGTIKVE